MAEIICWGFWNILWEYISFVLHPFNISFLTQASSPIHFCSKSRLPTRSKGRKRYPAAILKRSLGKESLDGQQAHTDGTVHVLYMSIVDTIKNVPLCKSRVEFVTAFSPFASFFLCSSIILWNSDMLTQKWCQPRAYLPGAEVNHDHEGGSSRVRPLHCTPVRLTPTITPNVGNSSA